MLKDRKPKKSSIRIHANASEKSTVIQKLKLKGKKCPSKLLELSVPYKIQPPIPTFLTITFKHKHNPKTTQNLSFDHSQIMSNPYFRNYWGIPSSSSSLHQKPSFRGIPVAAPKPKAYPNVISIPVHFGESERGRSDSALKIQKVLRGFLVRKNLKKIDVINNELNQIERRISDHETIDLIRRDPRERLRISETLMNLLFRLDSVTSVDFGVRGYRKSVIKKAIALQEKLDLFASDPDSHDQGQGGNDVEVDNTNVLSLEANSDLRDEAGDYGGHDSSEGISELREHKEATPVVSVSSEVMSDSGVL